MEIVRLPKVSEARPPCGRSSGSESATAAPERPSASSSRPPATQPDRATSGQQTDALVPQGNASVQQANAEVLLWQSRLRLGFGLLCVKLGVLAWLADIVPGFSPATLWIMAGYLAVAAGTSGRVRRTRRAPLWMVATNVAADIVLVFGITVGVVPPQYYDRALLLAFAILHLTEFYFGRALATAALGLVTLVYLDVVALAITRGAPLVWAQELWSLGIFGLAAGAFIMGYGSFRQRLATLASLFERAEEGDFSDTYDVEADRRPDSITMLGRAYNRVREQLATMVLTEPLSGCLNRRGLEQQLARELARAVRGGDSVALLVLDVDYFKRINDTFGHLAGDAVVREMGEILRAVARTDDLVARLGGDEFALLLPGTGVEGAFRTATRIREVVAARGFRGVSGKLPITVSIGIVADRVTDADAAHDLHARADEALYQAKDGGRNRVTVWTPNLRAIAFTRAQQVLTAP